MVTWKFEENWTLKCRKISFFVFLLSKLGTDLDAPRTKTPWVRYRKRKAKLRRNSRRLPAPEISSAGYKDSSFEFIVLFFDNFMRASGISLLFITFFCCSYATTYWFTCIVTTNFFKTNWWVLNILKYVHEMVISTQMQLLRPPQIDGESTSYYIFR